MKLLLNLLPLFLTILMTGCTGGGGGSAPDGGTTINKFTVSGAPLTIEEITSSATLLGALSTSQTYYGRVLYIDGLNLYSASIRFDLNKNNNSTAYFSDFYIDRLVRIDSYDTVTTIVNAATSTNVTPVYSGTNSVTISNATSRFVGFSIDFGDNTHFSDISNAGVIFSSDFTTMVGGNDSTFIFIAQKASAMPAASIADISTSWSLANFSVNASGVISVSSTSKVTVGGLGGNGLTAFVGNNSSAGSFQGETVLTDSITGVFAFGYDTTGMTPPTADGYVDGVYLLSPDKMFVLGYDFAAKVYFAASK